MNKTMLKFSDRMRAKKTALADLKEQYPDLLRGGQFTWEHAADRGLDALLSDVHYCLKQEMPITVSRGAKRGGSIKVVNND